jgi:hypothetical protein
VHECVDKDHTSLRPSSIVNITGGIVEGNLYGAGYLGTTYGSVYVNVGTDAIDSCEVSRASIPRRTGVDDSLYAIFKPGVSGAWCLPSARQGGAEPLDLCRSQLGRRYR